MTDAIPDLAALITASDVRSSTGTARQPELGFRQGLVLAWNSLTNENRIRVGGTEVVDVPALATADTLGLRPNDLVGLLRFRQTYFVLGRITLPNTSRSFDIQANAVNNSENTTSTTFTDLATPGPTIANFYVGSARRVLIFTTAFVSADINDGASYTTAITGASDIPFTGGGNIFTQITAGVVSDTIQSTLSHFALITASSGLNEGLHTFTMKYESALGGVANFGSRLLIVWAF